MYTLILCGFRFRPHTKGHPAGIGKRHFGSVKILKHSAMLSLHVIEGLNIISLSSAFALVLLVFLQMVRESLSCCSPIWRGLYFGARLCFLTRAPVVHVCGFQHLLSLSVVQSWQVQLGVGECSSF